MNASLTTTVPGPRPKVFRPPASLVKKQPKKPAVPGFLLFWGAVFLVLVMVSITVNGQSKDGLVIQGNTDSASVVPQISVTPDDNKDDSSLLSRASTMLSPPISDAQASTNMGGFAGKFGKTILLQSDSETIVGQMAKIPMENEQITEIKPVTDIDNDAGHELLSIISKY